MPESVPTVRILSKPECHLCDVAKERVTRAAREVGFAVEVVDISRDPRLMEAYGERIPVILVGDEEAFVYRVNEKALKRMVRRGFVRRRWPFLRRNGGSV